MCKPHFLLTRKQSFEVPQEGILKACSSSTLVENRIVRSCGQKLM